MERRLSCSKQYYEFCQDVAESEQNLNYPHLQRCYDRGDGNRVLMVDTRDKIAGTHSYTDCVHGWKPTLKESSFHSSIAGPTYAMKYFDETMRKEDIAPEYAWAILENKNGISPDLLLGPSVVIDAYNGDFIHSYGHARISYPLTGVIVIKSTNKGFEWDNITINGKVIFKDMTLQDVSFRDVDFSASNIEFDNVHFDTVDFHGAKMTHWPFKGSCSMNNVRGLIYSQHSWPIDLADANSLVLRAISLLNRYVFIGQNTDIRNVIIEGVDLTGIDITGINGRGIGVATLPNEYEQAVGYIKHVDDSWEDIQLQRESISNIIDYEPFTHASSWVTLFNSIPFNRVR